MNAEYNKERGYIYRIQYHIAWACYKKQSLLTKDSMQLFRECIEEICQTKEMKLLEDEITTNYVYLVLDCKPKHNIPDLLKSLKGASARYLLKHSTEMNEAGKNGVWDGLNIVGTDATVLQQIKEHLG